MKNDQFGLQACYEAVEFEVEYFKKNIFEELGRAIARDEQDPFFNPVMIQAYKKYINDHQIHWDSKF